MEKLDKVIAVLECCIEDRCDECPYDDIDDERPDWCRGDCVNTLFTDVLGWLKEQNRLICELSDNIPCCDNCEGKTVFGERTDKCVYEIEGFDSVIYCASRGIENCFGYQKKINELTEENERLKRDLKIARLQRKQAWEKLARITGEREAAWLEQEVEDA